MKCFLLFLLLGGPGILLSQSDSKTNSMNNLWLTAKVYPSLSGNMNSYGMNEFISSVRMRPSLSGGIELTKKLKNNWFLETGILISDWGFKEEGSTEGDPVVHKYVEKYVFCTVPLNAIYYHKQIYFGLGLNTSYFISGTEIKDGIKNNYSNPNQGVNTIQPVPADYWLFGMNAKIGYRFDINDKFSFRTEITGLFAEHPTYLPNIFDSPGLFSFGMGIGLDYQM